MEVPSFQRVLISKAIYVAIEQPFLYNSGMKLSLKSISISLGSLSLIFNTDKLEVHYITLQIFTILYYEYNTTGQYLYHISDILLTFSTPINSPITPVTSSTTAALIVLSLIAIQSNHHLMLHILSESITPFLSISNLLVD